MVSHTTGNGHSPGILERAREEAQEFCSDFTDVRSELQTLGEKEMELLRSEMAEQRRLAMQSGMLSGIAAIGGLLTFAFTAVTLMFILDSFLDTWLAALLTTLTLATLTGVAAFVARARIKEFSPLPKRTVRTLREDAQWARDLLRSNMR